MGEGSGAAGSGGGGCTEGGGGNRRPLLEEVLAELHAAEEEEERRGSAHGSGAAGSLYRRGEEVGGGLLEAAHAEAARLDAVVGWYRGLQAAQMAGAGLRNDPVLAPVRPGGAPPGQRIVACATAAGAAERGGAGGAWGGQHERGACAGRGARGGAADSARAQRAAQCWSGWRRRSLSWRQKDCRAPGGGRACSGRAPRPADGVQASGDVRQKGAASALAHAGSGPRLHEASQTADAHASGSQADTEVPFRTLRA